jgi:hypothetical protein
VEAPPPRPAVPRPGINRHTYTGRPGDQRANLPGGRTEFRDANGRTVRTNSRGQITRLQVNRGGDDRIQINRGTRGERMVESRRNGVRVVSYGPRNGFVERSVKPGYVSRTYIRGGRPYVNVYRGYRYRGYPYYYYMPSVYYGPRSYGWVMTPWPAPVPYAWFAIGRPAPWFRFYAGYFAPYPVYISPNLWLTDYLLAENLRLAYASQQAGAQLAAMESQQSSATVLTPTIKKLIAEEIRNQLAAEQTEAAQAATPSSVETADSEQTPTAFRQRYFVVSSNMDLIAGGQECSLTPGDIIQRIGTDVSSDGTVSAMVIGSKPGNCAANSRVDVDVADLQEMQNQFREQIDAGLKLMAQNQAKGLPAAPEADARTIYTAAPAEHAADEIAEQESAARALEAEIGDGLTAIRR